MQILPAGRDPIHQARAVMAELKRLSALSQPTWNWSRCAVIACEWKYLVPVRTFCEAQGIPVQMGDEEIPGFWHLRETRAFLEWLRARKPRVVDGAALKNRVEGNPSSPWHDLLRQAVEEHALETGGSGDAGGPLHRMAGGVGTGDTPSSSAACLLSTAHRAKGLEFDHVAVLDGGWDRVGNGVDKDAPRRLYYVAMTRARLTLTLARFDESHVFLDALAGHPSVMRHKPADLPPASASLGYHYVHAQLSGTWTWASPDAFGQATRSTAPSPGCHRAIRLRLASRVRDAGSCSTGGVRWWGVSPLVSNRRPAPVAAPPKCGPSPGGAVRLLILSITTP